MTTSAEESRPGSLLPPLLAIGLIGLGFLWASWSAREDDLAARTRRRLA